MEKVGVAAVVNGLSSFLGDMGKMDDSIRKLISPTNILGSTFGTLGNIISNLVGGVFRTLEYALGSLIADAIQYVVGQIKELIANTIEAGKEFQTLELRLRQLNFNTAVESGMDFNAATEESIRLTKEQMTWLQKIAAQTPYDNTDISNVYTLARGYGFADKEARGLTETIIDFTSGMGLGNVEIQRIIKNFGQMQQIGKVTQRELNDLAVGAFVPVNDILKQMRLNTGLSGKAFDNFRNSSEGVTMFLTEFTELVEGRFGGAAQKMARTFGAATDNLKDFFKSIIGLNIVKPILDILGSRLASFMDELTSEARWDTIVGLANRIGSSISSILEDIFKLAPDAAGMADIIVNALGKIADWIDLHHEDIVNFAQDAAKWLREDLAPAIEQVWGFLFGSEGEPGAIQKFGAWLKDDFVPFIQREVIPGLTDLFDAMTGKKNTTNTGDSRDKGEKDSQVEPTFLENVVSSVTAIASALPSILELFSAIGEAIMAAFGEGEAQTFAEFVTNDLIPAIQDLTKWVKENEEVIGALLKIFIKLEIISVIVGLLFNFLIALTSLVVGITILGGLQLAFDLLRTAAGTFYNTMKWTFEKLNVDLYALGTWFWTLRDNIIRAFNEVISAIRNKDWLGAGKAVVDGIWRGIKNNWAFFIAQIRYLARQALNTFYSIFQIRSPSAAMWDVGEQIVKGLAQGVSDSAGIAMKAMTQTASAVMAAASPQMSYSAAMAGPTQNTYATTNNFNATFNSNTKREPLIQDFSLMQSMVGG